MKLATTFYAHDECGCRRAPLVGSRYRRMRHDLLTGTDLGYEFYTVTEVEPIRHNRIFCRRVTLLSDDGWTGRPQVQAVLEGEYEAVENVMPLRR